MPGIHIDVSDNVGYTPPWYAYYYDHFAVMRQLVGAPNIDVNLTNKRQLKKA
jgi:hypothetical protein